MLAGSVLALVAAAVPAFAATITQPSSTPTVVPASAAGAPYAFTVQGSGFAPGANVFIEQCDGSNTSDIFWDPSLNCDLGSSPAPAPADANGNVTFGSNDVNHKFTPFKGTSPQGLFDCLASNDPPSVSGNPSFTNCQVRLSTNNTAVTSDQVFFPIMLPNSTTKVNCAAKGSASFVKPLTNTVPKKEKAPKIKGAGTLGSAAGGTCTDNAPTATKYPVSAGTVKIKGTVPAASRCAVVSNPKFSGTALTVKWQGINPKTSKLSTAGKSTVMLGNGTVAAIPTGGWVATGTVTAGSFLGSTVRVQLALDSGVTGEANTCAAGSLGGVSFNGTLSPSSIAVL